MIVDFHCHLDLYPDPLALVAQTQARQVATLSVTTTPRAYTKTAALADDEPMISTALGLHPELAEQRHHELGLFEDLLPATRFVGEIGLDGSKRFTHTRPTQRYVFDTILRLCAEAGGRIMSIHTRAAVPATLDALEAQPDAGVPVLHWFTGTPAQARRSVQLGCWFSLNAQALSAAGGRALIELLPRDRVLTETDGPFTQTGTTPAKPWDAAAATSALAEAWRITPEDAEQQVEANLRALVAGSQ